MEQSKPTKPLSAYSLFFRDTVNAIKQQNPTCSFQELSRVVASMWDVLDPAHKEVYQKKAELAIREYLQQVKAFEQQQDQLKTGTTTTTTEGEQPTAAPSGQQLVPPAEGDAVQMCIRKNCNKPAIRSPDWEDEYCSNECVVVHCREVFNDWLQSNLDSS